MQARFTLRADKISPDLAAKIRAMRSPRPVLEAAGLQIVSLAKRAFADASLRPSPWPPRKDRKPHQLLRLTGALWQSIRITELTDKAVRVGSDRKYAAVQQLGSKKKSGRGSGIPARPFLPFTARGLPTPVAARKIEAVMRAKVNALLKP